MIVGPGKPGTPSYRLAMLWVSVLAVAGFTAWLTASQPGPGAATPDAVAGSSQAHEAPPRADPCQLIREELTPDRLGLRSDADAWRATQRFYDTRDEDASWWTDTGPSSAAYELARVIRNARALDGLDPEAYGASSLPDLFEAPRTIHAPEWPRCFADLSLTYRFALYATDLARGRVSPRTVVFPTETDLRLDDMDVARLVDEALVGRDVAGALGRIRPVHPWYPTLVAELARYRAIAEAGGWPPLPLTETLRPGDQAPAAFIQLLQRRLAREGYLGPVVAAHLTDPAVSRESATDAEQTLPYNEALLEGVRQFQAHHGLEVDGIIGARTRDELNVPVEDRIRSIEITLDHLRWLPRDTLESLVLVVNVPGFELHAVDDGRVALRLRVIVGSRGWKTPLLDSAISEMSLNPDWNIPASITRLEVVPKIQREAGYLERERIAVLDPRTGARLEPSGIDWSAVRSGNAAILLRQAPGPLNPLGDVKFRFPSRFGVYLHDTNARSLFEQASRALSHGCMRLDHPFQLVERLEERLGPNWSLDRVGAIAAGATQQTVPIDPAVPIHVVYWTATVGPDARVRFHDDIYRVDAATREALIRSGRHGPS